MNIDFILPFFCENFSQGSFIHFSLLAKALQDRNHSVVIRSGNATSFSDITGGIRWENFETCGPRDVAGLQTVYYKTRSNSHLGHRLHRLKSFRAVLSDAWKLRNMPLPIDIWRLQQLSSIEAEEMAETLAENAEKHGPSSAFYSTLSLGPHLPIADMVADAKKRNATIITGYFPFKTCADAIKEAKKQAVPVWLIPLFHALDASHHNPILFDALREADGIFANCPYNKKFYESVFQCKRVPFAGVAPPPASLQTNHKDNDPPPYCVVFGRFHAGKNVGEAIRIVEAIRRKSIPNMELKLIAADSEELRKYLPPYASILSNISSDEAMQTLTNATALLCPSIHESFSIVCVEALRCGTPALIRKANRATYSIFEKAGITDFTYEQESQAISILEQIHSKKMQLPVNFSTKEFTWERIAKTVEESLNQPSLLKNRLATK